MVPTVDLTVLQQAFEAGREVAEDARRQIKEAEEQFRLRLSDVRSDFTQALILPPLQANLKGIRRVKIKSIKDKLDFIPSSTDPTGRLDIKLVVNVKERVGASTYVFGFEPIPFIDLEAEKLPAKLRQGVGILTITRRTPFKEMTEFKSADTSDMKALINTIRVVGEDIGKAAQRALDAYKPQRPQPANGDDKVMMLDMFRPPEIKQDRLTA